MKKEKINKEIKNGMNKVYEYVNENVLMEKGDYEENEKENIKKVYVYENKEKKENYNVKYIYENVYEMGNYE